MFCTDTLHCFGYTAESYSTTKTGLLCSHTYTGVPFRNKRKACKIGKESETGNETLLVGVCVMVGGLDWSGGEGGL